MINLVNKEKTIDVKMLRLELRDILANMTHEEIVSNEKQIINDFIQKKIDSKEVPDDFSCEYFECHELYKEIHNAIHDSCDPHPIP